MISARPLRLFAAVIVASLGGVSAHGQGAGPYPELERMDYDALSRTLTDAQLFRALGSSKQAIDGPGRCGPVITRIQNDRASFDALQRQYAGNPTAAYQRQAIVLQEAIDQSIADYERCFQINLSDFSPVTAVGVQTFAAHRERYAALAGLYGDIADFNGYVAEVQARMNAYGADLQAQGADIVGRLAEVQGDVQYRASGTGPGMSAQSGQTMRLGQWIETGAGSARLELTPQYQQANAGTATVWISGSTIVRLDRFNPGGARTSFIGDWTLLDLIRGVIRANLNGAPPIRIQSKAALNVRGTEVAVSYDPDTDHGEYVLDHGDASLDLGDGREIPLTERTSVTVRQGRADPPQPVSDAQWARLVQQTDSPVAAQAAAPPAAVAAAPPAAPPGPATARYAGDVVRSFVQALKDADPVRVRLLVGGRYQEVIDDVARQNPDMRSYFESSSDRPAGFRVNCTICSAGGECWTDTFLQHRLDQPEVNHMVFTTAPRTGPPPPGSTETRVVTTSQRWNEDIAARFNEESQTCSF